MFAPIMLRTTDLSVGAPRYVQPATQSNSSGNHPGRAISQMGLMWPPTPSTESSAYPLTRFSSHSVSAAASSSMKAMMSPTAWAMPVLRASERPRTPAFSTTTSSENRSRALSKRAVLWSMTTTTRAGGIVWSCTDSTAATSWSQRSSV